MEKCIFCHEQIQDGAFKCKHCKKWQKLKPSVRQTTSMKQCPFCEELIEVAASECNYCKEKVKNCDIGGKSKSNWKCPRCNSLNEMTSDKCACGYASRSEKYETIKNASGTKSNNLEAYKAWQSQIKDGTDSKNIKSIICLHCDENIPGNSTKCPYCAENIDATKLPEETIRKIKEEPSAVEPPSTEIAKSSNLSFQDNNLDKTSSANQSEHDSAGELKKKIMKLEKLLSEGILSEEEFKSKREQLIKEYLNE